MRLPLLTAIFLILLSPICFAQMVWPGDVTNNGIVNEVDLLYWGFAFNESGSARINATTEFTAQETIEWAGSFPNGLNFAYADCNGDGLVDETDAEVVKANFGSIHDDIPLVADEILQANPGDDPGFAFLNENLTVVPGERINLNISLGNETIPIKNLLGLAFTIRVDTQFFQNALTNFELDDVTWIKPFGNSNESFTINDEANGKITVAFTTTDKKPVSGAGLIGTISIVIVEDIIDFLVLEDTVKVMIDSITVTTDSLEKIPILGTSVILEIVGRPTSTYNPILDKIKLYPNPNSGWVLLQTNDIPIEKVELVNTLGQIFYQKPLKRNAFHSLDLQAVPKGIYWLRMITDYGTKSTKIQRL